MALLNIVRDAAIEVGLIPPSVAASSQEQTDIELVYLANKAARDVAFWHDWSIISKAGELTGDGVSSSFDPPADFDRLAKRQRIDGGIYYSFVGPLNDSDRTELRSSALSLAQRFYFRGGLIVLSAPLSAGEKAIFEYQSKDIFKKSNGAFESSMSADDSYCILDESIVTLGVIWMWLRMKRQDYSQEYASYKEQFELLAARDTSMKPVYIGARNDDILMDARIPDTIVVP